VHIVETADGWHTFESLKAWARSYSELIAIGGFWLDHERERGSEMELLPGVIALQESHMTILRTTGRWYEEWPPSIPFDSRSPGDRFRISTNSMLGAVIRAAAAGWDVAPERVIEASDFLAAVGEAVELAKRDGKPCRDKPYTILRHPGNA
jgi:hypothetical protein